MKRISVLLCLVLSLALLSGCAGTTVVYQTNCTCAASGTVQAPAAAEPVGEGAVKTGLAIVTGLSGENASEEALGKVEYDVTLVAVNVDDKGVITACAIDGIKSTVNFDTTGSLASDVSVPVQTKNELGTDYNMVAWGGAKYEWNEQAKALADYAVGKTVEELKNGAVNEAGYAADADLATTATIYIGGYVSAIEKAVHNARHLGAQAGDSLVLTSVSSLADSIQGNVQLNCDAAAVTFEGDTITSCYIDSLQAKVSVDENGVITSDLTAEVQTKNELGTAYNMVAWGGAKFEWNEQAANFAAYVTGKTAAEVAGIAVSESAKPADGTDLAASVTIAIDGFQALIAKAAK